MAIIGLEMVPTSLLRGRRGAEEEVRKVKALLEGSGLAEHLNTIVVPQIVPEDGGRPVSLEQKMDPLDFREVVAETFPLAFLLTQVTVFSPPQELETRVRTLKDNGIHRVVFIGAPRNTGGRSLAGPRPEIVLRRFHKDFPHRGVILIPTREGEEARFRAKVEAGATFALTQMLFNDHIVRFMREMARFPERPEIVLSFAYVPKKERRVGLLRWLMQHRGPANVAEMETLDGLVDLPFREKKARLVENYKRVVEGVAGLGYPVGIHFECPYGPSEPAFETFTEMLNVWSPELKASIST